MVDQCHEGSKWFCACGYQNYSVLFGERCRQCDKERPHYEPGIHTDFESGVVFWQCSCCFIKNYVDDWALNGSMRCFKCQKVDRYAKVRHEAKKKELHDEWIRQKNALCTVCNGREFMRAGVNKCDPCHIKFLKRELKQKRADKAHLQPKAETVP